VSAQDRAKWNTRYRSRAGEDYPRPDLLLLDYTPAIPLNTRPRALDLAGGVGQNGLWLAEQGYTVDILDISRVALDRASAEMGVRGVRTVNLLCIDLDDAPLMPDSYDLVCVFRFFNRAVLPRLAACVKAGGRVIYETFNLSILETRPDFPSDYCVRTGELAAAFGKWRVLRDTEAGAFSQFVAIKP
jgi:SAM-dependent methyltransferase